MKNNIIENNKTENNIFFFKTIIIIGVILFLLNLFAYSNHYLWAINFSGYLPIWFQITWFVVFVIVMYFFHRYIFNFIENSDSKFIFNTLMLIILIIAILVPVLFHAKYPNIQGDATIQFENAIYTLRLRADICRLFMKYGLSEQEGSLWTCISGGIVSFIICYLFVLSSNIKTSAKFALLLFLLASPWCIAGYGWYDSSSWTLVGCLLFFVCLYNTHKESKFKILWEILLVIVLVINYKLGPYFKVLTVFTAFYFFQKMILKLKPCFQKKTLYLGVIATGLLAYYKLRMPLFHPNIKINQPALFSSWFWFYLHTNISELLQICLPSFVLLFMMHKDKSIYNRQYSPTIYTFIFIFWSTIAIKFCSYFSQRFNEALGGVYTVTGFTITFSIIVLWLLLSKKRVLLWYCSLLSIYFIVPIIIITTTKLHAVRYEDVFPYEKGAHEYQMSPYVHLGLMFKDASLTNRTLNQFRTGAYNPLPRWNKFRVLNQLYLTAWCYEFGQESEGWTNLYRLYQKYPQAATQSLLRKGAQFTEHAHIPIRRDAKKICSELYSKTHSPIYRQILQIIPKFEEADKTKGK